MSDLTEFLLARIAEREAWVAVSMFPMDYELHGVSLSREILTDCAAKRRIVEHPPYGWDDGADSNDALRQWESTLRILAAIYAYHPGYRAEWRV